MYEHLLEVCVTEKQSRLIELLISGLSQNQAAKKLGVSKRSVERMVKTVRTRAEAYGKTSHFLKDINIPERMLVKKTSTYTKTEDGGQWTIAEASDQSIIELMETIVDSLKEEIPVYNSEKKCKTFGNEDLLNLYIITDYHLGMIAWQDQTGDEDWCTEKAERVLYEWFDKAIEQSPKAKQCIFLELGDFTHADNQTGTTPRSGNVLDVDVPINLIAKVAVRSINTIIRMLEKKYDNVHVIMADGNHNETTSKILSAAFEMHYSETPHITIDSSADSYFCYEFGNVSLFAHHGHKCKISGISQVYASKFREVFGRTKYSYAHSGHYHHDEMKEDNLMRKEQHRTLSAKDNHAAGGGYNSGRDAKVITYHKEYGEVGRITISREMLD